MVKPGLWPIRLIWNGLTTYALLGWKDDDYIARIIDRAAQYAGERVVFGKPLAVKLGKRGKFVACTGYREGCRYTRNLEKEGAEEAPAEPVLSEWAASRSSLGPTLIRPA